MTTVKRHFLRWLLTVCAVVCLFAVPAFAEEADPVSAMTETGTVLADDRAAVKDQTAADPIVPEEEAPINITQTALGFGLDWDFTPRAGLHFRYKWMTNSDEFLPENDWKGHYFAVETKMWF